MKILRIIASMNPEGGGPSEGIRQVGLELRRLGHDCECLTLDDPESTWLASQPLTIFAMGPGLGGYGYAPQMAQWLRQNARNYHAIIISGLWQYHSIASRNVLVSLGLPYLVFTHGMLDPWFKRTYPFKHIKKMLYWPWADYRVLRDANAVLFTSEEERRQARQSFRLYAANEKVVNYGSSAPPPQREQLREAFLQAHPALRGKTLLTFLSRIHPKKGCDLLIAAFAAIAATNPNLHLVMAGPDQCGWAAELMQQANVLGVTNRITWTGMLQHEQKWGALYASAAFALPSHQENFGIAVAEALGCGLPVLISDKVNIWREIALDGAGIVGADDLEGTLACLSAWADMTEEAQRQMARNAESIFKKRYTVEAMAKSILDNIAAMNGESRRESKRTLESETVNDQ